MIEVYPDLESLSRAAAALLVKQANLAVAARGRFSVALSGGATPRRTYELLAAPPWVDQAPWDRVHVFWGDERCVPLNDSRSNARLAKEAWLDRVPIPADQIHPMNCAHDPAAAARQYEAQLREFFAGQPPILDLVLLGLGDDGHTASLFPGTTVLEERRALGRRGLPGRGRPLPGHVDGPPDQPGGGGGLPGGGRRQGRRLTGSAARSPGPGAPAGPTHPAAKRGAFMADGPGGRRPATGRIHLLGVDETTAYTMKFPSEHREIGTTR